MVRDRADSDYPPSNNIRQYSAAWGESSSGAHRANSLSVAGSHGPGFTSKQTARSVRGRTVCHTSGRQIDAPQATLGRFRAERIPRRNQPTIIEQNRFRHAFEHQEGLRFRRSGVPVRPNVSPAQQDIQEPVWIVGRSRMEIVIHAASGRGRGHAGNRLEQPGRNQLYFAHFFSLLPRTGPEAI